MSSELLHLIDRIRSRSRGASPLHGKFSLANVVVEHSRLPAEFQLNAPISPPQGTRLRYPTDGSLPKIDGFEADVANVRRLAASPFVNRLNHIKQLSTASLSSALGGAHTRLEHTLGSYDIAVRMLRKANDYMLANESTVEEYQSHRRTVVRAALFLAFLHDAFHGPFGHVLDPIKGVLLPDKLDTRIDNTARHLEFKRAVDQQTGIVHALARFVFSTDADTVLQVAYAFLEAKRQAPTPLPQELRPFTFIYDILWSPLDHDRLDYIARDYGHLFLFAPLSVRFARIPDYVRIAMVDGEPRLVFDNDVSTDVTEALDVRLRLYNYIYESPDKTLYDEMGLHAAVLLLEEYGLFKPVPPGENPNDFEMGLRFLELTDADFIDTVFESRDSARTTVARMLIRDLLSNAPFSFAAHREIRNTDIPALRLRHQRLRADLRSEVTVALRNPKIFGRKPSQPEKIRDACADILRRLKEPLKFECDEQVAKEVGSEYLSVLPTVDGVPRYLITLPPIVDSESQYWWLASFSYNGYFRVALERYFWRMIVDRWPNAKDWCYEIASVEVKRSGELDEAVIARETTALMDYLLENGVLFCYMTKIVAMDEASGMLLRNNTREKIAWSYVIDDDSVTEIRVQPFDAPNTYWLAVLRPRNMPEQIDAIIGDTLDAVLNTDAWMEIYASIAGATLGE